ncbi:trihelix transcription factor ASIL2-like [Impatiens glandulifera]|uniref:trihelix transcription factor ASIL2-like n=1 Tax=Impatiens glandulifera TaxID=253017 RepID=UPI001FB15417|nr:trihelix transcription factor ASIL2-like [Impatiens glandulifera]
MEDDDEIQSHPSPDSGSPISPPSNGRITVTVAAAPPQKPLTLALPIQQGGGGGGGRTPAAANGGGREDCWSEGGTKLLIDAWGERYLELSRGNLKQKHWKEVADVVSRQDDYSKTPKTDIQCKNRIDTVKKKYKAEKAKISAGGGPSKWLFYDRLDYLIGPTAKIGASPSSTGALKIVPVGIPVGSRSANQFQQQQQKKPKQNLRRRAPVDSDSSHSDPEPSPDSTDSFPPESYERKRPRIKKRDMNSIVPPLHHNNHHHQHHQQQQQQPVAPTPAPPNRVKDNSGGGVKEETNRGNSVRELTRAIIKFGEAFEQAETSKLQQVMEMEKQRMKFTKELELQRMQFYMKTQLELSQIKRRRVGNNNNNNNNHHHLNNNNIINNSMANNNNNNSESSS